MLIQLGFPTPTYATFRTLHDSNTTTYEHIRKAHWSDSEKNDEQ